MARTTLTLLLGQDAEWLKASLEGLANDVITDAEAGQRGAKLSVMVRMLGSAGIANVGETVRLLREMKALYGPGGDHLKEGDLPNDESVRRLVRAFPDLMPYAIAVVVPRQAPTTVDQIEEVVS